MSETATRPARLTVVLVHGAFADASSWNGVIERLLAADLQVAAPANPLRGIAHDSAYIASFLEQIRGPERAGATIAEAEGSHVIMISQPEAVADVILTAAAEVDQPAAAAGG
jgi:alpha-beta hydrolase superfamily lysophospholipase